jgi:putative oxidoreductase
VGLDQPTLQLFDRDEARDVVKRIVPQRLLRCNAQEDHVTNATAADQSKLLFPSLASFYSPVFEIAYALLRVIIGYILLRHGLVKLGSGAAAVAGGMAKNGLEPASFFAYAAMFLETVGAGCLIAGLFTRFFGAALAIEMAIAFIVVHAPKGFAANQGGYEYVLLIGIVLFVIAIRGGGPYSLDRLIGKEL